MTTPTLQELNRHLFAELLPDTHGLDKVADAPKAAAGKKGGKKGATAATEQPTATEYTAEQLEALTAAGIADVTTADPQVVAAILGLPPQ